MKFKTVEIARVKKFYRVNRIIKLSVKLSEAIILFIVQQHYAENRRERERNRERERETQPRNFQSSEGDGDGARNYTKAPEVLENSLAR